MPDTSKQPEKATGILLVNLGSPAAPTPSAVRQYLREFLSDPRVVSLPRVLWLFILNLFVLPFRPTKSARAYRKIWTEHGSPLITISRRLTELLTAKVDGKASVKLAMRYGRPAIATKLAEFRRQGIERLMVVPLYPQYSGATTASVFDAVINQIGNWQHVPDFHFINDYYRNTEYIDAVADSIRQYWEKQGRGEMLLFSFHGLPAKSIKLGDPYFKQCHETASSITAKLGLKKQDWQVVFQSRFGRTEWLKPYCVEVLQQLPVQGINNVDVICPGFSVDCLETLEEIAVTNKSFFIAAGGNQFRYIPALNATPRHVEMLAKLVEKYL